MFSMASVPAVMTTLPPELLSGKNALRVFLFPVISTKYRRDVTEFRIGSVHIREMWIPE
jgi:hypothetical protein